MACYMCKKYNWEDPEGIEIVYKDLNGNEYCELHAPIDKKKLSVESFNELIFKMINGSLDSDENDSLCNLTNVIFPGDIDFRRYNKYLSLPPINLSYAHFYGEVDFSTVHFVDAGFEQCVFEKTVKFENAVFNEIIEFGVTTFKDDVWFEKAVFKKRAWFYRFHCFNTAGFTRCVFEDDVDFTRSKFYIGWFEKAVFGRKVDFYEAEFRNETGFHEALFNRSVRFFSTRFEEGVTFDSVRFNGETLFEHVEFVEDGYFTKSNISNASFREVDGTGRVVFRQCQAKNIYFWDTDLNKCDFLMTDMTNIHFMNSRWGKEKGRYRILEESNPHELSEDKFVEELYAVRNFYQEMKRKYKQENNEYEVSKWHIAEKEIQLKLLAKDNESKFIRSMLCLYKYVSVFGESPSRAICVLGTFICLVWGLLGFGGIVNGKEVVIQGLALPTWENIENFGTVFMTLFKNVMLFKSTAIEFHAKAGWVDGLVLVLTRLIIPLQAALFAFALRNRFRR